MPRARNALIHHIHMIAGAYKEDGRSDADLLSRYAEFHDEQAFTSLMVRHGFLVWSICRSILGNAEDAEDALQTTFMALARNATKIRVTGTLAGWMQRVARRAALDARSMAQSRQRLKTKLALAKESHFRDSKLENLHELLHEELAKLPERLRVVLVLHHLENKTQDEVARILGVAERTVRHRLVQGKSILERQLNKLGVVAGTATLSLLFDSLVSQAAMPHGLVTKTVQAASAFRDGNLTGSLAKLAAEVLKHTPAATPWWKIGWMITVLCVGGLGVGLGSAAWQAGFFDRNGEAPLAAKQQVESQEGEKPTSNQLRLDAYGDPLPPGALARLGTARFRLDRGFRGNARAVMAADGKLYIAGRDDVPWFCCDLTTGKSVSQFQDAEGRTIPLMPDLVISFDGRLMAQTSPSGAAEFWELNSGKRLKLGIKEQPAQMVLSPDSKHIAVITKARPKAPAELCVWNLAGKSLWSTDASDLQDQEFRLSYSADGKVLIAVCHPPGRPDDGNKLLIRRWGAASGKELPHWTVKGNRDGFACSRNGAVLAVCCKFEKGDLSAPWRGISLWDTTAGKKLRDFILEAGANVLGDACLSPSGKFLAVHAFRFSKPSDFPDTLFLWDAATGKLLRQWANPHWSGKLVFSRDEKRLVSVPGVNSNRFIYVWDVDSGKRLNQAWHERGHVGELASIAFNSQGDAVTSIDRSHGLVRWECDLAGNYRMTSSRFAYEEKLLDGSEGPAIVAPDGKLAAYATYHVQEGKPGEIVSTRLHVCDTATGKELATLSGPRGSSTRLAFSPKSNLLVSDHEINDGVFELIVHNLSTGKWSRGPESGYFGFHPNNQWMAVSPIKENVGLWDSATGRTLTKTTSNLDAGPFTFSEDGRFLAANIWDKDRRAGSIRVWRVRSDESGVRLEGPLGSATPPLDPGNWRLTFSPNGRILAAVPAQPREDRHHGSDVVIHLYETMAGQTAGLERRCFNEGGSAVKAMAFAPDGRRLASGHEDANLLIWDLTGHLDASKLRPSRLSAAAVASLWEALAHSPLQANPAIWKLAAGGAPVVAFLQKQLQPASQNHVTPEALSQLIANLDADDFAVRRKAKAHLENLAGAKPHVREALRKALKAVLRKAPSAEVRHWASMVLEKVVQEPWPAPSGDELRQLRGLEVLEQMDDPQARQILERLASGCADARLTQEAQAALAYWKQLHPKQ